MPKAQIFLFFSSLALTLMAGFLVWDFFYITNNLDTAKLTAAMNPVVFVPEPAPKSESEPVPVPAPAQPSPELSPEQKQEILDEIQEKLDIIQQEVNELIEQQNPKPPEPEKILEVTKDPNYIDNISPAETMSGEQAEPEPEPEPQPEPQPEPTPSPSPSPVPPRIEKYVLDGMSIYLEFSERVKYKISIKSGGTVFKKWNGIATNPDIKVWDGTNEKTGEVAPAGEYTVEVYIKNEAGLEFTDASKTIVKSN